ncbi:laminin subunit beta-3 isoform X1 [Taeniopygia guttata]|uniref:laminin subunit beta-3 isoform X1 n=1 Tax=Taeniopygia guttata TaxID=59729 RepID=UPI003BB92AE6
MEPRCQLWPWAVLVLLGAPQLLAAQGSCSQGACYPAPRDLLLGRAPLLTASSTCGLSQPETYCTPHGQWSMKCCRCDSRLPHSYSGHRVENVLASAGRARWWQSQNGVPRVSLRLDLEQLFQLDSVVLHFRSPPAAMLIERSLDAGRTWQVLQYLASDCATAFPHVPPGPPEGWQDPRCQELRGHPLHGGTVKFSVRELGSAISSSSSQAIGKLGPFTNLRINFTELPHIPRQGYHSPSTFYAVTELQVLGSCFCHGHAERCSPGGERHGTQVPAGCVCQHNTAGPHCERCAALFNARPWAPAEDSDPHACQPCDCNGHASSCHFDPEVFQASGGAGGGVCDGCQHNTEGTNCERCRAGFFRDARRALSHPEACLPCECDPEGTVPGSVCDPATGRCVCKDNVQGDRCHLCKPGFAQLAAANPAGCRRCTCNALGTRQDTVPCDGDTGSCLCLPGVVGSDCGQCAAGHWGLGSGQGCRPCACDPRGSRSPHCNQFTGQCPCRDGFTGQTCSAVGQQQCPPRHYRDARGGCTECDCDFQGTEEAGCDRATGRCLCRAGVTGARCEQCQRGHCSSQRGCQPCHPCFHTYDGDIQRLHQRQAGLANATARLPAGTGGSRLGPRLSRAQGNLQQALGILGSPAGTQQGLARAGSVLAAIREQVQGINPNLHFLDDTASLLRELEALNSSLLATSSQFQSKKSQFESSRSTDLSGAFQTIRSASQSSSRASSLAKAAPGLLAQARESRRSAVGLQGDLAGDTAKLLALRGELASGPDLRPVINQVCGGARVEPCTPARCQGLLCPRDNSSVCGAGRPCHGLLPLASGALAAAGRAAEEFGSLSARLRDTAQLIQRTELSATQIQSSTRRLAERLGASRTQLQGDVRRVQQLLQRLRGVLADKDTDPASIQEISESVLSLRLPTDAAAVRRRMTEIQKLAAELQCPEDILAQTAEDIARAKRLQQEAEQARNRANAVEASVEEVLGNLQRANTALLEAQGALRGSGSSLRFIRERVEEVEAVLGPAQGNVAAVGAGLAGLAGRLSQLQRGTEQNRLRAGDTRDTAGTAAQRAGGAQQALAQVKELFSELQSRVGQGPALGEQGRRVQSIGREAQALFQETLGMVLRMETLESEIQEGNKALVSRMSRLSGLEEQVGRIRDSIKRRVAYYESCS